MNNICAPPKTTEISFPVSLPRGEGSLQKFCWDMWLKNTQVFLRNLIRTSQVNNTVVKLILGCSFRCYLIYNNSCSDFVTQVQCERFPFFFFSKKCKAVREVGQRLLESWNGKTLTSSLTWLAVYLSISWDQLACLCVLTFFITYLFKIPSGSLWRRIITEHDNL